MSVNAAAILPVSLSVSHPVPSVGSPSALTPDGFDGSTLPLPDPWLDLYLPATRGAANAVRALIVAMPQRGSFLAVGARAMEVLGAAGEARRLAELAFRAGGPEALALATFLLPQGESVARLREQLPEPGRRADAACDRIVLALRRGNLEAAQEALSTALTHCPDHREAQRWGRMLAGAAPLDVTRRHLHGLRGARGSAELDGAELIPNRVGGWISPERLRRRALNPVGEGQPLCSALGRLQQAGITACWLTAPHTLAAIPADDPRVELELLADGLVSLCAEGRDASGMAARLLAETEQAGETGGLGWEAAARADAVALVAVLATAHADLVPAALGACHRMNRRADGRLSGGHEGMEWRAWIARLTGDATAARALLEESATGRVWQIAMDALRCGGQMVEANRRQRQARLHPDLAVLAREEAGLRPVVYR